MADLALDSIAVFAALDKQERLAVSARIEPMTLRKGDSLFEAGERANAIYFVRNGLLLQQPAAAGPSQQFRAGDIIGADTCLALDTHVVSLVAGRDSDVLRLDHADYTALVAQVPRLAALLLEALARQARRHRPASVDAEWRSLTHKPSILVMPLVDGAASTRFMERLRDRLPEGAAAIVDATTMINDAGIHAPDDDRIGCWLDRRGASGEQVILFASSADCAWARSFARHADEVLLVTEGAAQATPVTALEALVTDIFARGARRLVRLHETRQGVVSGTPDWLDRLPVAMHHHVSLEDNADIDAVVRFITGTAVGLVAGGGGGLGAAYGGIWRAFDERGTRFDMLLGTSVGASMLAGLAYLGDHETLEAGTEEIFVTRRSFKRLSLPRHALLDHKTFDQALRDTFGADTLIEDCWRPYAALVTNLSTRRPEVLRTGPLWQAVRASTAIPCILPPFITSDGMMLADGCIMDDAPLATMQGLKQGPNLVVHFGRTGTRRVNMEYESVPGRAEVLRSLLPWRARPRLPNVFGMLYRTMLAHQHYDLPAGPQDLVLNPPNFPGASMISFDKHRQVSEFAYRWTQRELDRLGEVGSTALDALFAPLAQSRLAPDPGGVRRLRTVAA